jgi:hypothetical protein
MDNSSIQQYTPPPCRRLLHRRCLLFLRVEFEVTVVAGGLTVVAGELSYLTFLYKFTIFLYGVYVN